MSRLVSLGEDDTGVVAVDTYLRLYPGRRITRGGWKDAERHGYEDEVEFTRREAREKRVRRRRKARGS